jgi:hypothetical protein
MLKMSDKGSKPPTEPLTKSCAIATHEIAQAMAIGLTNLAKSTKKE